MNTLSSFCDSLLTLYVIAFIDTHKPKHVFFHIIVVVVGKPVHYLLTKLAQNHKHKCVHITPT